MGFYVSSCLRSLSSRKVRLTAPGTIHWPESDTADRPSPHLLGRQVPSSFEDAFTELGDATETVHHEPREGCVFAFLPR